MVRRGGFETELFVSSDLSLYLGLGVCGNVSTAHKIRSNSHQFKMATASPNGLDEAPIDGHERPDRDT